MTLLRLTAPGVPDIYQGTELLDLSLVDPDNRRPVDFARRRALLAGLAADADGPPPWDAPDGRAKLYLIRRALALRERDPALFADGDYRPLAVSGPYARHLCAFARVHRDRALVVIAPRLLAGRVLEGDPGTGSAALRTEPFADPGWAGTLVAVPGTVWKDRLGGGRLDAARSGDGQVLRAADVLRRFPVGLLTGSDGTAGA
jgi:(1->4)-alpha-D-glucan 1-alpha-D-glucosylmutase